MNREERAQEALRVAYVAETGNTGTIEAYWRQPVGQMEYGDRYAIAAMLAFADAETAAMRRFVSLVANLTLSDEMAPDTPCEDAWMTMDGLIRRARALLVTREVERG